MTEQTEWYEVRGGPGFHRIGMNLTLEKAEAMCAEFETHRVRCEELAPGFLGRTPVTEVKLQRTRLEHPPITFPLQPEPN